MSNPFGNPAQQPWLQALLEHMYPGSLNSISPVAPPIPQRRAGSPQPSSRAPGGDLTAPLGGWSAEMPSSTFSPGGGGVKQPSAVGSPAGANVPLPPPDPRRVGGAPTPGIPAPTPDRVSNNPSLIQYMVGGNARGGRNAPIYTAHNFGPQVPAMPQGALSASTPQAPAYQSAPMVPGSVLPHDPVGTQAGPLAGPGFMDWLRNMMGQQGGPIGPGGAYSP